MPQCDTPLVCGLIIHNAFMLSTIQTLTLTLVLALRFWARSADTTTFERTLTDFSSSSCGKISTVVMFDWCVKVDVLLWVICKV
jgi:hypothetical protein